jgi:hypothetical protein
MTSKHLDPLGIEIAPRDITHNDILFLGCSYTVGHGLPNGATKYSSIFSRYYNKQEINLAASGSGNYRSFDLIGQLNITSGASVVLQITELSRIRWYHKKSVKDIMLSVAPNRELLTVYNDEFLIYDLIRQLRIITKLCRVNDIKLIIWSIARPGIWHDNLETYLSKFPEYIYLDSRRNADTSYYVDNATDGLHPGPGSNQLIAEKLIDHFNKLYS